jgi:hypothetical protein
MSDTDETTQVGAQKIFAYTKDANLSRKSLQRLEEAGYIPVPVENFDCIKLIEPMPDAAAGAILSAALTAIKRHGREYGKSAREEFALALLEALLNRNAGVPEFLKKNKA